MKRIAIIALPLLLGACGQIRTYEHSIYGSDGKITSTYKVKTIDSLITNTKSTSSVLTLADGTTWNLQGSNVAPDPNALTAIQNVTASLAALGTTFAKFLLIP